MRARGREFSVGFFLQKVCRGRHFGDVYFLIFSQKQQTVSSPRIADLLLRSPNLFCSFLGGVLGCLWDGPSASASSHTSSSSAGVATTEAGSAKLQSTKVPACAAAVRHHRGKEVQTRKSTEKKRPSEAKTASDGGKERQSRTAAQRPLTLLFAASQSPPLRSTQSSQYLNCDNNPLRPKQRVQGVPHEARSISGRLITNNLCTRFHQSVSRAVSRRAALLERLLSSGKKGTPCRNSAFREKSSGEASAVFLSSVRTVALCRSPELGG